MIFISIFICICIVTCLLSYFVLFIILLCFGSLVLLWWCLGIIVTYPLLLSFLLYSCIIIITHDIITEEVRSYSYLIRRVSVAIQRGNAATIAGTTGEFPALPDDL